MCRKKQHVRVDDMKERSDLICGKAAVGGNYNSTRDTYITQDSYVETLCRLQEIFYLFKNESMDLLTDDELLDFMREQFEQTCFGDLDYLESTCLESFAREVRADYRTYWRQGSKGDRNEY